MKKPTVVVPLVLAAVALAGCSGQSPVAPDASAAAVAGSSATERKSSSPGTYALAFTAHMGGILQEVTSLPVSSAELILMAYVTDSSGQPAAGGTVTFDYCSFKGGPPNDITRADEAPKEACEQGTASWTRLRSVSVSSGSCALLGTGYACLNFGVVAIPRDIGFRFRYSPQGSGIASGTSEAKNFTWVPAS